MKNIYDIAELAHLYCPGSIGYNAQRRFVRLLKSEKELWDCLCALHYRPYQRALTPKQYAAITAVLGDPDEA